MSESEPDDEAVEDGMLIDAQLPLTPRPTPLTAANDCDAAALAGQGGASGRDPAGAGGAHPGLPTPPLLEPGVVNCDGESGVAYTDSGATNGGNGTANGEDGAANGESGAAGGVDGAEETVAPFLEMPVNPEVLPSSTIVSVTVSKSPTQRRIEHICGAKDKSCTEAKVVRIDLHLPVPGYSSASTEAICRLLDTIIYMLNGGSTVSLVVSLQCGCVTTAG